MTQQWIQMQDPNVNTIPDATSISENANPNLNTLPHSNQTMQPPPGNTILFYSTQHSN